MNQQRKPPRYVEKKRQDSDQLETIKEVTIGIFRHLAKLNEDISAIQQRIDNLTILITRDKIDDPKKSSWLPKDKKEITTVVALVVFALTVLAIILASCGVIGCDVKP